MSNIIIKKTLWVIMSKERKLIAKGGPRDRYLVEVNDDTDNKRVLTYNTKIRAELAYKESFFFNNTPYKVTEEDLEPVKITIIYEEVENEQ
jgi:hypothetical protein